MTLSIWLLLGTVLVALVLFISVVFVRMIQGMVMALLMAAMVAIIAGQVWYATDILGERVPGPALVASS